MMKIIYAVKKEWSNKDHKLKHWDLYNGNKTRLSKNKNEAKNKRILYNKEHICEIQARNDLLHVSL